MINIFQLKGLNIHMQMYSYSVVFRYIVTLKGWFITL